MIGGLDDSRGLARERPRRRRAARPAGLAGGARGAGPFRRRAARGGLERRRLRIVRARARRAAACWMTPPAELPSLVDLGRAIRAGETTSEAATERCLAVIRDRDPSINAFITVLADAALDAARTADRELRSGRDRGRLHGVPFSIKDIFDVTGLPTTAASHVRREHVAGRDATVVARLRNAGAVFVGKRSEE